MRRSLGETSGKQSIFLDPLIIYILIYEASSTQDTLVLSPVSRGNKLSKREVHKLTYVMTDASGLSLGTLMRSVEHLPK